jgi:hypothetical protein
MAKLERGCEQRRAAFFQRRSLSGTLFQFARDANFTLGDGLLLLFDLK